MEPQGVSGPGEMHFICPSCREPTMHARPDRDRRVIRCDLCRAETAFEPLPALLWLTGASGSGKTAIYEMLVGRVHEAILIDADLLWNANPAHNDPGSNYRMFYQLLFHLAMRLARNGKPVMLEGTTVPPPEPE